MRVRQPAARGARRAHSWLGRCPAEKYSRETPWEQEPRGSDTIQGAGGQGASDVRGMRVLQGEDEALRAKGL